jgi:hypothetical protein
MKILGAQIQLQAAHAQTRQSRTEERVQIAIAAPARPAPASQSRASAPPADAPADPDILYLELLIEMLSGRDVHIARIDAQDTDAGTDRQPPAAAPVQLTVSRSTTVHYSEAESSAFAASATLQTADGERHIDVALLMQRRFESSSTVTQTAGNRQDPLLLDLAGSGPQLSAAKFAFDLDADGSPEHVSMPTGASAFLAIDRNRDGRIGDGSELFGALSGDGFAELARHDDDGNGFIDSGDAVYGQLLALRKGAQGQDLLAPLAALGVGALYLGSVETPFELKTASNETLGVVRRSGLWIGEHTGAGTLQQVDLVV